MAITTPLVRDWSYRGAQRRLRRASKALLPRHTASVCLDAAGNRIVECSCGWAGNGLGWLTHLDQVVSSVLRD
jgi:hypothetical protein